MILKVLSLCTDLLKLIGLPVSVIWVIFGNVLEHSVLFSIVLLFGLMPIIDEIVLLWYGRNVTHDNIDEIVEKICYRRSSYMLAPSCFEYIDKQYVRKRLIMELCKQV